MTDQELIDEFDILSIEQKIDWALDTIRHKESFGMDELSASLSRERRAKGVLLDCKETIEKQKKEIKDLKNKNYKLANTVSFGDEELKETIKAKNSEIENLIKEAKKELSEKDKTIAHLSSECTRLFDPTRKFWNDEKDKAITEAREIIKSFLSFRSPSMTITNAEKAKAWIESIK